MEKLITKGPQELLVNMERAKIVDNYLSTKLDKCAGDNLRVVLATEQLVPVHFFTTGHSGCIVLKVNSAHGLDLVLKLPIDEKSQAEVYGNIEGFDSLRSNGLSEMIPDLTKVGKVGATTYIITTFLGTDFSNAAQRSSDPVDLYQQLAIRMERIYEKSIQQDDQSRASVMRAVELLRRNFIDDIVPAGLVDSGDLQKLARLDLPLFTSPISCFGVFDFTPEDVYLTQDSIKYPDPKLHIRGNPIIDLACFAGVSRDVYVLPGANQGYNILKDLAIEKVSSLLRMSRHRAKKLFKLGRALQCSLSARFRIATEPELARKYALQALMYLSEDD